MTFTNSKFVLNGLQEVIVIKIIQFILERKVIPGFIRVIILSLIAYVKDENMRIENKRNL